MSIDSLNAKENNNHIIFRTADTGKYKNLPNTNFFYHKHILFCNLALPSNYHGQAISFCRDLGLKGLSQTALLVLVLMPINAHWLNTHIQQNVLWLTPALAGSRAAVCGPTKAGVGQRTFSKTGYLHGCHRHDL